MLTSKGVVRLFLDGMTTRHESCPFPVTLLEYFGGR
jgi:hypothetical protein